MRKNFTKTFHKTQSSNLIPVKVIKSYLLMFLKRETSKNMLQKRQLELNCPSNSLMSWLSQVRSLKRLSSETWGSECSQHRAWNQKGLREEREGKAGEDLHTQLQEGPSVLSFHCLWACVMRQPLFSVWRKALVRT